MSSLLVIATIKAKAGKEQAVEQLLRGLLDPTHAESGCLFYALHRHVSAPGSFFFVEKWRSQADLEAHLKTPHVAQAVARQSDLIDVLDIAPVVPISGGNLSKAAL